MLITEYGSCIYRADVQKSSIAAGIILTKFCQLLTQHRLHHLLSYSPETGIFKRHVSVSPNARAGDIAGSVAKDDYIIIMIDGVKYPAHHLAWFWMTGRFPEIRIDHINGRGFDNRWCNLRSATASQNGGNRRRNANSNTGFKGVSWHRRKDKFNAQIGHGGKHIHLGYFDTAEDAHKAYMEAATRIFGEFARAA